MNLRPIRDQYGFPPCDDVPASILTENGSSEVLYGIQCCAFFAAIFQIVGDRLSTPDGNVVDDWNGSMCQLMSQGRTDFFARLKSTYDKVGLVKR